MAPTKIVSRHEHYFHTPKDEPPAPEQWVIDRWAAHHAAPPPGTTEPDPPGTPMSRQTRHGDGHAGGFRVGAPEWREDEASENGGYWVIVSEAGA